MKKIVLFLLCLTLLLALAACGKGAVVTVIVTEVNETSMLVTPIDGSDVLLSAAVFDVALTSVTDGSTPEIGSMYEIHYDGTVLETYPAAFSGITKVRLAK